MTIETKCLYDDYRNIGQLRVLVSRYWPRGKSWEELNLDMHLPELGPSGKLLKKYKDQIKSPYQLAYPLYIDEYVAEMKDNPKAIRALQLLNRLSFVLEIELLCFELEGEACHRYTLKDILRNERWWTKSK